MSVLPDEDRPRPHPKAISRADHVFYAFLLGVALLAGFGQARMFMSGDSNWALGACAAVIFYGWAWAMGHPAEPIVTRGPGS